jgi:hypothetical protein
MSLPPPPAAPEPADLDIGTAGASARREHERWRANREQRVREKHPHLGGFILALTDAPQHEKAWSRGADGEEQVARSLGRRLRADSVMLHDRRIPGTRANIDHLVIAPSGVWVVDAKRYKGKVAVAKPLFGEAKLTIAGRDRSRLIDGLDWQVGRVRAVLAELHLESPVHGALCFLEADLPFVGNLTFRGYPLLYCKRLAKRMNAAGPLTPEQVHTFAYALANRLPSK